MEERVCPTWIVSTYQMLPDCSLGVGIWSYLTHHAHEIVSICLHIFSHKKILTGLCGSAHSELWHVTETRRMAKSGATWWIAFSLGTLSEKKLLRLKPSTKEKSKKSVPVTQPEHTPEPIGSWDRNGLDLHRASSLTFWLPSALVTHPQLSVQRLWCLSANPAPLLPDSLLYTEIL